MNQRIARKLLERIGQRADVDDDGRESLHASSARPYDIVLMDVQMPVIDGLEAQRRVRAGEAGSSQPWIIALSANAVAGDREPCLEAGMDVCLSKPIRLEELRAALVLRAAT